jgi:levanase/fructan beta-fructosidase
MRYLALLLVTLSLSFTSVPDKTDKKYYQEKYRPQYHFTPEKNWMNDPNGLVYYGGEYHLFYQYNPNGKEWGFMHWGHAVSKDLIRWEHLPVAINPDEDSKDKNHATAFSGSAVVDENNIAGLQQGEEKTLLAYYTSFECGQRLAYSNDKGRTWHKYAKNPLIPFAKDDARDPKVFFHAPSGKWVMVLYRRPDGDEAQQGISVFTSLNLINWELQSHIAGYYECPDLFELPLDGDKGKSKWVLLGGSGEYRVGSFDGKQFSPETPMKTLDYGKNFYATQTWSNHPEGKVVQLAWMRGGEYPDMPFNGQMTFPCELSLRTTQSGPTLCRKPIEAIATLHGKNDLIKKEKNIIPGLQGNLVGGISGKILHIKAKFNPKTSDGFGFIVRNGKKEVGTEIRYDTNKKLLSCMGGQAVVEPKDGLLQFEILLDRSSIEIFVNDGEVVLSSCFTPAEEDDDLTLWTQGGELFVNEIQVYELKSAWNGK